MRFVALSLVSTLAFAVAVSAQEKKEAVPLQPISVVKVEHKGPVDFDKEIQPILARRCLVCHAGTVTEGDLDLSKHAKILEGGGRGPSIVPGKSADSLLVQLAGRTKKPFMPPKKETPFTPEELALVKLWIDQGAKPGSGKMEKERITLTPPPAAVHPIRSLAISPNQSFIAAGRGNQIFLYDAAGRFQRNLVDPALADANKKPIKAAHASLVESLAVSPDGKTLASGSFQEVILWDPATGAVKSRLGGFAERVVCLAFSPDGKLLAVGGGIPTEPGEIKVFDLASLKPVLDLKNGHSDTVFALAFSPDGKRLATASADKFVKVFEIPSGKLIRSFEGHTHHVMDVGWQADGKALVSGGADNVIKVWDLDKGEQIRTFGNYTKQITRLVFKGKTPEILVCSGDQTVRTWNITNGASSRNFPGATDYLYAVATSADGKLVATGGEEGIVRIYDGATGKLVKAVSGETASEMPVKPKK